jgi:hypothetical protein
MNTTQDLVNYMVTTAFIGLLVVAVVCLGAFVGGL